MFIELKQFQKNSETRAVIIPAENLQDSERRWAFKIAGNDYVFHVRNRHEVSIFSSHIESFFECVCRTYSESKVENPDREIIP